MSTGPAERETVIPAIIFIGLAYPFQRPALAPEPQKKCKTSIFLRLAYSKCFKTINSIRFIGLAYQFHRPALAPEHQTPCTNQPLKIPRFQNRPLKIPRFQNRPLKIPRFQNRPLKIPRFQNRPLKIPRFQNRPSELRARSLARSLDGTQPDVAVLARGLVLFSRSSLGVPSMSSTRALAVALQTRWPPPLARVPLALRDLVALSCCSRALRVEGLGGLLVLKKMLDHWSAAVLRAKIQEKEDQFEQWLREDTERFLARWGSWIREAAEK